MNTLKKIIAIADARYEEINALRNKFISDNNIEANFMEEQTTPYDDEISTLREIFLVANEKINKIEEDQNKELEYPL